MADSPQLRGLGQDDIVLGNNDTKDRNHSDNICKDHKPDLHMLNHTNANPWAGHDDDLTTSLSFTLNSSTGVLSTDLHNAQLNEKTLLKPPLEQTGEQPMQKSNRVSVNLLREFDPLEYSGEPAAREAWASAQGNPPPPPLLSPIPIIPLAQQQMLIEPQLQVGNVQRGNNALSDGHGPDSSNMNLTTKSVPAGTGMTLGPGLGFPSTLSSIARAITLPKGRSHSVDITVREGGAGAGANASTLGPEPGPSKPSASPSMGVTMGSVAGLLFGQRGSRPPAPVNASADAAVHRAGDDEVDGGKDERKDKEKEQGQESGSSSVRDVHVFPSLRPVEKERQKGEPPPFDFQQFLDQLKSRSAEPVAKYLRSFLSNFAKKPLPVHDQIKAINDFLNFISRRMLEADVWRNATDTEFDNALEAMEKLVMNRLYEFTFAPQLEELQPPRPVTMDDLERDRVLAQRVALFGWVEEKHLEVPEGPDTRGFLMFAQQELLKINHYKAPRDKLICLLNCCKVIFGLIRHLHKEESADAFLPILIFVVLKANPPNLISNIEYIQRFRNPQKLQGEPGYYLSSLMGAVHFIETMDHTGLSHISAEEFELKVEDAIRALPASPPPLAALDLEKLTGTNAASRSGTPLPLSLPSTLSSTSAAGPMTAKSSLLAFVSGNRVSSRSAGVGSGTGMGMTFTSPHAGEESAQPLSLSLGSGSSPRDGGANGPGALAEDARRFFQRTGDAIGKPLNALGRMLGEALDGLEASGGHGNGMPTAEERLLDGYEKERAARGNVGVGGSGGWGTIFPGGAGVNEKDQMPVAPLPPVLQTPIAYKPRVRQSGGMQRGASPAPAPFPSPKGNGMYDGTPVEQMQRGGSLGIGPPRSSSLAPMGPQYQLPPRERKDSLSLRPLGVGAAAAVPNELARPSNAASPSTPPSSALNPALVSSSSGASFSRTPTPVPDTDTDIDIDIAGLQAEIDAAHTRAAQAALGTLEQIFPGVDREVVQWVLEAEGGDLGRSIEKLLEVGSGEGEAEAEAEAESESESNGGFGDNEGAGL